MNACAPCIAAWGEETAEMVCPPHTESQIRLAREIARMFQDDASDEKTGWFMEDVEAVSEVEGDGWVIEQLDDWRDNPVVSIQGALYALDINAEGHAPIEPFAMLKARYDDVLESDAETSQ